MQSAFDFFVILARGCRVGGPGLRGAGRAGGRTRKSGQMLVGWPSARRSKAPHFGCLVALGHAAGFPSAG